MSGRGSEKGGYGEIRLPGYRVIVISTRLSMEYMG